MNASTDARRMRPARVALVAAMIALAACVSASPEPPAGAERAVRTEANGDLVEEYRVGGMLRMVRITPRFGVPYYLIDRNADGRMDNRPGQMLGVYYKLYSW